MAVLIGNEPVNSGNTGWSKADVMTALEKVFYELGWNSGTQKNGVPVCCKYPGWQASAYLLGTDIGLGDGCFPTDRGSWFECGGKQTQLHAIERKFYVRNDGQNAYLIKERITPSSWGASSTNDTITSGHTIFGYNGYADGTKVTYAPGETVGNTDKDIGGLTPGQNYWIGRDGTSQTVFKLYNSQAEAINKTNPVDITTQPSYPYSFYTEEQSNPTITINIGDELRVVLDDTSGGQFYFMDMAEGGYVADRAITGNPYTNHDVSGTGITGTGTEADPLYWNTVYWHQTEDEPFDPSKIAGIGYQGVYSYGYANDTHTSMKGSIVITPNTTNNSHTAGYNEAYYKYTVPASGNRSELKLRIYRDIDPNSGSKMGTICHITIHSVGEGWSNNEVFTIPASAIGGTAANAVDIVFGVNSAESSSGAYDGTPSIHVTNLGAGQNMFQKHPNGDFGILRRENDSSKKFGTTYWGISFRNDNNGAPYRMFLNAGIGWNFLNTLGEHCPNDQTSYYYGKFQGEQGLDLGASPYVNVTSTHSSYHPINIASINQPTSYPLNIRYYKAQSPQDTEFAIIQFTQTVNTEVKTYATLALHAGPHFGANIYDLDDQWTGTYTEWKTSTSQGMSADRWVDSYYNWPGYASGSTGPGEEPLEYESKAREGSYGWMRNPSSSDTDIRTRYECNIDSSNSGETNQVITYFRDSTYDKYNQQDNNLSYVRALKDALVGMPSTSDYYKPIKGLPICNQLAPCPYYIPDDFVMLQVHVSPGQTEFRTGDQIDISSSEKYKVIIGDNQKDQTGIDGIAGNSAIGTLFCARIT